MNAWLELAESADPTLSTDHTKWSVVKVYNKWRGNGIFFVLAEVPGWDCYRITSTQPYTLFILKL